MNHTHKYVYKTGAGDLLQTSVCTGQVSINIQETLAASGTPKTLTFTHPNPTALVIQSSVDATVQFQEDGVSVGSPVTLVAGVNKVVGLSTVEVSATIGSAPIESFTTLSVTNTSNPLVTGTITIRGKNNL
jgi:hypothetical protein